MDWPLHQHGSQAGVFSEAPPRVAFFLATLRCGGAEQMTVNLIDALAAQQVPVDLVLAKAEGELLPHVPPQVRIFDLDKSRMRYACWGLARYLRRERPFGLISRVDHSNLIAAVARALSSTQTRLLVTSSSRLFAHVEATKSPRGAVLSKRSIAPLMRWAYRRADAVVAVSQGVAQELSRRLRLDSRSVRVIRNPVVTRRIATLAQQGPPHRWFDDPQTPVVLSVGRLVWQKDFETLLTAFSLLQKRRPARLLVLGEGPLRPKLENLRRSLGLDAVCDMPGYCPNPYAAMARAGLLVLSSRSEGSPNVLAEALSCGCPVVATDCPTGPKEILAGGKYGLLAPVGDAEGLARTMQCALDKSWNRDELRCRAARYASHTSARQYLAALGYPIEFLGRFAEVENGDLPTTLLVSDERQSAARPAWRDAG